LATCANSEPLAPSSIWLAGTSINYSSADIYDAGSIDPTTVTDATRFPYTTGQFLARTGDTVFFHGVDNGYIYGDHRGTGYYGAWRIDSIRIVPYQPGCDNIPGHLEHTFFGDIITYDTPPPGCLYSFGAPIPGVPSTVLPAPPVITVLNGEWYYQTERGSGNFTTAAVPEPSGLVLFAVGLLLFGLIKRRSVTSLMLGAAVLLLNSAASAQSDYNPESIVIGPAHELTQKEREEIAKTVAEVEAAARKGVPGYMPGCFTPPHRTEGVPAGPPVCPWPTPASR